MSKFNHPFTSEKCKERLFNEYKKYKSLLVAFDFDNTIFDFHNEGGDYSCIIELLKKCNEVGFKLILFTAEDEKDKVNAKLQFCTDNGIKVDYVNEDPIFGTRKPYYNILLDDRAGLEESYEVLSYVINQI